MNICRLVLPLIWMLAVAPALACQCVVVAREQVIAATLVVFDGEVIRAELDAAGERQITTLRVHRAIKGISARAVYSFEGALHRRPERTVTVISRVQQGDCGWDFRAGPQRLIVGANRDSSGILVAGRCTMYNLNR